MLSETASRLLRNPMIIAIVLGLVVSLLELRLPVVATRVIEMLAGATAPVALFVIGAALNGLKVGGTAADVAQTSIGKLLLHPLLMFAALWLIPGVDSTLMVTGVLFACAPMMSVLPILGQHFGLRSAAPLLPWPAPCWPSSASAWCSRCCAGRGCCRAEACGRRFSGELPLGIDKPIRFFGSHG